MEKYIHFLYYRGDTTPDFRLIYYISIRSFLVTHPNCKVLLHTNLIPDEFTFYWLLIDEFPDRFKSVLFNDDHLADLERLNISDITHKCDYLRLRILYDLGGIYTDLDNVSLIGFEDAFNHEKPIYCSEVDMHGYFSSISNGYMYHPKGHEWTKRMIDLYDNYNKSEGSAGKDDWVATSILKPTEIYNRDKSQVLVLPAGLTNPSTWEPKDRRALFMHKDLRFDNAMMLHLDEGSRPRIFWWIDIKHIMTVDTSFTLAVRRYVSHLWDPDNLCPTITEYR